MDINEQFKTFLSFLKKKGCYETFKYYYYLVEEKEPTYHNNLSIKKLLWTEIDDVILFSFYWGNTSEGWDYWNSIDNDWRELVDNYGW